MEVIVKLKNNVSPKVKKNGMFVNGQKVTRLPVKLSFKDKKEADAFLKSKKFKAYMEKTSVAPEKKDDVPDAQTTKEFVNEIKGITEENEEKDQTSDQSSEDKVDLPTGTEQAEGN